MGNIRIVAPPQNPYYFGKVTAVDMDAEKELGWTSPGGRIDLPAEGPIDLGIAWSRIGGPAVKLRFVAEPGRTYILRWMQEAFAANIKVEEACEMADTE